MGYRISVDTGGTFTDVVVSTDDGRVAIGKALTDTRRAFDGLRAALERAAEELGTGVPELLADTQVFLYGTTRATNGIVQRRVARTALLVTAGFPDILVLKEGGKSRPHDLRIPYPEPYVPRSLTFEVPERIDAEGGIVRPLDEDETRRILATLRARSVEAVAVCLLWSIVNPVHERRVGELLRACLPGVPYTLSHELNPIIREYRRASSTAIDASLKPLMQEYLRRLEEDLREAGYQGDILISTSYGGVMHLADVVQRPINLVKSGPAMAPVAGRAEGRAEGLGSDVIVCDAGGTTFDVSLIRDGEIQFTRDTWLGEQWTGDALGMASVDVRSIGAGGGSIAWVDPGGLLRVGPQSAGADPGPACYGRGGRDATVTDAAVVLGYIDPAHFLGGRMALDEAAAHEALGRLGRALGLSTERAAWAVFAAANENMIGAIKEITINEGVDPSEAVIVAGGGAAGLNVLPIAAELGCRTVLVPRAAGALSASGMQISDLVAEFGASRLATTDAFDYDGVNAALGSVRERLEAFADRLRQRGFSTFELRYFVEARYRFQVWELEIPLPGDRFDGPADVAALVERFHEVHRRVFAVSDPEQPVECLNWRGMLAAPMAPRGEPLRAPAPGGRLVPDRVRPAWFGGHEAVETPVYLGAKLGAGQRLDGPAIVEEPTTTLVVYPGMCARITARGRYLLTPAPSADAASGV